MSRSGARARRRRQGRAAPKRAHVRRQLAYAAEATLLFERACHAARWAKIYEELVGKIDEALPALDPKSLRFEIATTNRGIYKSESERFAIDALNHTARGLAMTAMAIP